MTKWIESKEGIIAILQHGAEVAQAYQKYLDNSMHFEHFTQLDFTEWHSCISVWMQKHPEYTYIQPLTESSSNSHTTR